MFGAPEYIGREGESSIYRNNICLTLKDSLPLTRSLSAARLFSNGERVSLNRLLPASRS